MTNPFPHHVLPEPADRYRHELPKLEATALFRATDPTIRLAAETIVAMRATWHLGVETIVHTVAKRAGLRHGDVRPHLRSFNESGDALELAGIDAAGGAWPEGFTPPPGLFEPIDGRLETTRDDAGHVMRGIFISAGRRPQLLALADCGMPSGISFRKDDKEMWFATPLIFLHDDVLYAAWAINPVDHVHRDQPISTLPDGRRWEQVDPSTAPLPAGAADLL